MFQLTFAFAEWSMIIESTLRTYHFPPSRDWWKPRGEPRNLSRILWNIVRWSHLCRRKCLWSQLWRSVRELAAQVRRICHSTWEKSGDSYLPHFPCRAKKAATLFEQRIGDNAIRLSEVKFLLSITDLKDSRYFPFQRKKWHSLD